MSIDKRITNQITIVPEVKTVAPAYYNPFPFRSNQLLINDFKEIESLPQGRYEHLHCKINLF